MTENSYILGTVFIVDDERSITSTIERLLRWFFRKENLPYEVVTSQSAMEALTRITENVLTPAVIVSDIIMSPVDGIEFLRKVKQRSPNTQLIVLTGYANEQAIKILKEDIELYSYKEKPWNDEDLLRTIKNALYSYRRLKLLNRYVPKEIIQKTIEQSNDDIIEGIELEATIMFLDIRDSTDLFHLDNKGPKDVIKRLNIYFEEFLRVLDLYQNAILDKFVGDGFMALFGVPEKDENPKINAINAVDAALIMRHRLETLNKRFVDMPLHIGIGISTGMVVAGNIGTKDRANFTVLGRDVNIASRLERLAKPIRNGILIGESTYRYIGNIFKTHEVNSLPAKGKRESIRVYEVLKKR